MAGTMAREFYLGIDLGTTNSALAYGIIDAFSQKIMPEIVNIHMSGVSTPQPLVPSVVKYKKNATKPAEIGVAAKEQLRLGTLIDPETVIIKSIKLQMGQKIVNEAKWLKPENVSADLLKFLKNSAEKRLINTLSNVVICIPACFDSDMWAATHEAAILAGFEKIYLLDEPKAALLDFVNDQERYAPQDRWLDFSEPKTICVFDPGGGTIDVSIVRVRQIPVTRNNRELYEMEVEDLGLTRQLFLGGDDFDKLVADFLAQKFLEQNGVDIAHIPILQHRNFAQGKLLEYAEAAKKNLTDRVSDLVRFGTTEEDAMNQAETDIQILFLYNNYNLNYTLTYHEFIEVIEPLLGQGLSLKDIDNLQIRQKLAYQQEYPKSENIIMPVFDALSKAQSKLGSVPKVDAVIVNGGMSKVHIVRQRMKEFFGSDVPIIESPSPDLSVARGAVIHHYNIVHNLVRTSSILPDAISLEVGSRKFISLIPSNTKYPTERPIRLERIELTIPRDDIPYLDIPLWRGEPPHPTAKLIDRRINFEQKSIPIKKGDILDLQISIDGNRQLILEAWLRDKPDIRFEVRSSVA